MIPDSIVYSDCWRGYNSLDISEFKHYRINHSKLFADKKNHINGIENFWNQAKTILEISIPTIGSMIKSLYSYGTQQFWDKVPF